MKKNTSKILASVLAIMMVSAMAACGTKPNSSSSAPSTSPAPGSSSAEPVAPPSSSAVHLNPTDAAKLYSDAITGARDADFNDAYNILTNDRIAAIEAAKKADAAITDEDAGKMYDSQTEMIFSLLGFTPTDAEAYAVSVSPLNVKAYGIAVVKPAEGKQELVEKGLTAFIEGQRKSFEQYLVDQYEVAKAGYVKTLEDGTVIMVVTEGQDEVYAAITKALSAK